MVRMHKMDHAGVRASTVEKYEKGVAASEAAPALSRVNPDQELRIRADPSGQKPYEYVAVDKPKEGGKFARAMQDDGWRANKAMHKRAPEMRKRRESSVIGFLRMRSKADAAGKKSKGRYEKREAVGLRAKWGKDAGVAGAIDLTDARLKLGSEADEAHPDDRGEGGRAFVYKGPYRTCWPTMVPREHQSKEFKKLHHALAETNDGSQPLVGYSWREVRELLEREDARHAAARPRPDPGHSDLHALLARRHRAGHAELDRARDPRALARARNAQGRTPAHLLRGLAALFPARPGAAGSCGSSSALARTSTRRTAARTRCSTPRAGPATPCSCARSSERARTSAPRTAGAGSRRRSPARPTPGPPIADVVADAVGPARASALRLRLFAADAVVAWVATAVGRNRPYRPYSYDLYREGKFPRANSVRPQEKKSKPKDVDQTGGLRAKKGHPGGRTSWAG
ncbi:hypothetical protein JL722_10473 [Aureococcus anophagefferens]|nr:hypothetical protein JL722_10473 [Aureococcus anophagefferens]